MVGLFGGSFDPIHHGHLLVAQSLVESLGLRELRFVPASQQPFKQGRHGAAAEHRARMVELAIRDEPQFLVERCELERPAPSYMVDTLRLLHQREPGVSWTLLLGGDAARDLGQWRDAAEVARLARVVVFARGGAPIPQSPLIGGVAQAPTVEISATVIRQRIREHKSVRYMVPEVVAEYIREKGLYL